MTSKKQNSLLNTMLVEHFSLRIEAFKGDHYGNSKKKFRVPLGFCSNPGEGCMHPMLDMGTAPSETLSHL